MTLSSDTKLSIKTSALSAIFTVMLFMLVNYFFNHSLNPFSNSSSKNPPITIQGTGSVSAQPDQSTVSFTVNKTANTLQDAQNQANTFTNKIVADLQKIGIAKQDIQTSNYNSSPNYSDNGGPMMQSAIYPRPPAPSGVSGFTVSEDVEITIHDISKANGVIDTITKDGAEDVSGPDLTFSDAKQQDLENQARTKAIENAKEKAQSMADAAGIHLGKLVKIQEDNQNYPIFRPLMMNAAGTTAKSVPTQINPGQNTVTSSVTLSYETY